MLSKEFFNVDTWYVQNEEKLKKTSLHENPKAKAEKAKGFDFAKTGITQKVSFLQEKANGLLGQVPNFSGKADKTQPKQKSFVRKMLDL